MKAQFATFEALIAALVIASAVASMVALVSSYNNGIALERQRLLGSAAIYDLSGQLLSNESAGACLNSFIAENDTACLSSYLQTYQRYYSLSGIGLEVENRRIGNFSGPVTICLPYNYSGSNITMCLGA